MRRTSKWWSTATCLFCAIAALLLLISLLTTSWLHYRSQVEPMDFGLFRMCYTDVGICVGPMDIWFRIYNEKMMNPQPSARYCFGIGFVSCFGSALCFCPGLSQYADKTGLSFISTGFSVLSWVAMLISMLVFVMTWKDAFALDPRYLQWGWSIIVVVIAMLFMTVSLPCQYIHLNNVWETSSQHFFTTKIGRQLIRLWDSFSLNRKRIFQSLY